MPPRTALRLIVCTPTRYRHQHPTTESVLHVSISHPEETADREELGSNV